jgi:hypothetical protein
MNRLEMGDELLNDIYKVNQFNASSIEENINFGNISEKDKFLAAKQILLGIAILYIVTIVVYSLDQSDHSIKLLDICFSVFPSLATLIVAFYFKEKSCS